MSQTSKSTSQSSLQEIAQQKMLSKLLWCAVIAFLLIVIFAIIPPIITLITYTRSSSSFPPNSTATVTANQVQDLSYRANQQLLEANSILSQMTSIATVMGVVLAVFAVVTVGLGAFGFFTNNGFRDLEVKWRSVLSELQEEATTNRNVIDTLQKETEQKQQDINELQERLKTLRKTMEDEVAAIRKRSEDTNRALTHLILGNQLLEQRRREQAVEAFEKAQKLRPDDPQINYALGRAYSGVGDYDRAINHLSIAAQDAQKFPQAQMELGLAYRRRGNKLYEEAVLEKDQKKKRYFQSRAQVDYKQAIEHLTRANELHSDYEDALATLGGLYRRMGDYESNPALYEQALEYYEKASQADPNSSYALGNLASLLWYTGKHDEALTAFARTKEIAKERIVKLVRPAEVYWDYYDLALAQLALGETEQARQAYEQAIEKTPGPVEFDGVLSNLYLLRKADTSMTDLERIIKMVEDAKARQRKK